MCAREEAPGRILDLIDMARPAVGHVEPCAAGSGSERRIRSAAARVFAATGKVGRSRERAGRAILLPRCVRTYGPTGGCGKKAPEKKSQPSGPQLVVPRRAVAAPARRSLRRAGHRLKACASTVALSSRRSSKPCIETSGRFATDTGHRAPAGTSRRLARSWPN